jgi:immune inhibitor A
MRKAIAGLAALGLGLGVFGGWAQPAGGAAGAAGAPTRPASPPVDEPAAAPGDEPPNPLEDKRRELRETALTDVLNGDATPERRGASTVVRVSGQGGQVSASDTRTPGNRDQYVELAREQTDRVFVVLAEFGDERHADYPDGDTDPDTPGPARFDGPRHNEIPEPDRSVDNSTVWQPDYGQDHFQQLFFGEGEGVESLRTYYERQSSGRYSVDGTVTDWVRVRYNEARYGRSNGYPCDDNVCDNTWALISDAVNQWEADQRAAGRSEQEIADELATFDIWDRYDYDGDGDFNEPDGYIDHFQIVHAGGDQADGDPSQGEDAIWSHRWYAYASDVGNTGPSQNPLGGAQIGGTGVWVGDYTIQPENGGLSVFAHEFGHDLGLPDHYDTAGGQNGVEWWTLMAQSRLSAEGEALGTRAGDLSAWDKLQLGWLDYEVMAAGQTRTLDLGPHEYNSAKPQGVVVTLPRKRVTFDYGDPAAGERMWWSTSGDNLSTSMTRPLDLTGATSASLSLQARFEIEAGYDYAYAQASTDGGATWTSLDGTIDGEPFVRDGSDNPAISGSSGGEWTDVVVPLDAYAGQAITFRFLYRTDGGVAPDGFFADEVTATADGTPLFSSGAEDGEEGWALDGFRSTTGTETADYDNYYIASHRSYVSYDQYLRTGPYNFGWLEERPDWVEHFSYEQGMLVSYWDTSQTDNNTSEHVGQGEILVVDAHPRPIINLAGVPWRSRIQAYDAPFSLTRPRSFTLHVDGRASYIRGGEAQPLFDDRRQYLYPELPQAGVTLPGVGVRIRVLSVDGTSMQVRVGTAPPAGGA